MTGLGGSGPLTGAVGSLGCAVRCCQSHAAVDSADCLLTWASASSSSCDPSFAHCLGRLLGSSFSLLNAFRMIGTPALALTVSQYSLSIGGGDHFGGAPGSGHPAGTGYSGRPGGCGFPSSSRCGVDLVGIVFHNLWGFFGSDLPTVLTVTSSSELSSSSHRGGGPSSSSELSSLPTQSGGGPSSSSSELSIHRGGGPSSSSSELSVHRGGGTSSSSVSSAESLLSWPVGSGTCSVRRMLDTLRSLDTFLPWLLRSGLPFQTIDLGAWSTDMLLSLLTSESSADWLAASRSRCTRLARDTIRWALLNFTLGFLFPSFSADFSCGGDLAPSVPCSLMKWVLRSSAVANVLPQLGSKHLVEVHHLVLCLVLLQFLHGACDPRPGLFGDVPWCLPGDCWYRMLLLALVLSATCCRWLAAAAIWAFLREL